MAVSGVMNVYDNQMAKTVFFCPSDWPAVTFLISFPLRTVASSTWRRDALGR